MKYIDLSGQKFGRLTAISPAGRLGSDRAMWWLCKCECGNETKVPAQHLKSRNTKSCGCLAKEKHCCVTTHGLRYEPLYQVWWLIIERCENPKRNGYENYGGRGIKICEEWKDVSNFITWAKENGWEKGLEIDRIDVNGNYEPSNCRFVTHKENANNRRDSRYITYDNRTQTIAQWSEEIGISVQTLRGRLNSGWSVKEAFTTPTRK